MKSNIPFSALSVKINFTLIPSLLPLDNQFSIGNAGKHEAKHNSTVPEQMLRLYGDKYYSCTEIYWIQPEASKNEHWLTEHWRPANQRNQWMRINTKQLER